MIEALVILICLLLNAIFAAVEMAFVTVTRPRLRELARAGHSDARRILRLRENPERTLSVLQIGITVVAAVAAAVGGISAVNSFSPWFEESWGLSARAAEGLSILVMVLPITYLSVVLGELVPKTLALRNPLQIVLRAGRWLLYFDRVLSPVVSLLEASTRSVLKLFIRPGARSQTSGSEARETEPVELEGLSNQTREYVLNLVDLEHKRICDVRLPWWQAVVVNETDTAEQVESVVLESGHTRLPVVREDLVVGVLNTKEFMVLRAQGGDWRKLIRPVVRVNERSPILRTLRLMQEQRSHLSITYLNGERSGLVTVEDILEEIIGDLYDEDDDGVLRRVLASNPRARYLVSPPL